MTLAVGMAAPAVADDCSTTCPSGSGPIKVFQRVGAGTLTLIDCKAAAADFSIDISSWSGDNLILISDCGATPPTSDIGRVTITGDSANLTSLLVAIVGASEDPNDLDNRNLDLDPACVDVGGLLVADEDTRAKTRASISVTNTIEHRGTDPDAADVEVNQIVRIQSENAIDANIVATGQTGTFLFNDPHIGQVRAGKDLAGNIVALSGDIFAVRVLDPGTPAGGEAITGDILAENGRIGTIFTTRPIGDGSTQPKIYAGDGIEQIRTVDEAASDTVLARSIDADIQSNRNYVVSTPLPWEDGAIWLVECGGDLEGSIKAGSVTFFPGESRHAGVLVRGVIAADIDITNNLENADIIADSILGSVTIGCKAKGAIVATQPAGVIESVEIGFGTSLDDGYEEEFPRGLTGHDCRPFHALTPDDWFAPPSPTINRCSGTTNLYDGGSINSLIKADEIVSVKLRSMTIIATADDWKDAMPRVEAVDIGDIQIDDFRAGVVWSGELEYELDTFGQIVLDTDGYPVVQNDPDNDYAKITSAEFGCVGITAHAFIKACPAVKVAQKCVRRTAFPRDR